jgi:hypothetical protein
MGERNKERKKVMRCYRNDKETRGQARKQGKKEREFFYSSHIFIET